MHFSMKSKLISYFYILAMFLWHSWDTTQSYQEHTKDHQIHEDGVCSQVC